MKTFAERNPAKGSRRAAAQRSEAAGLAELHGAIGNRALANVLQRWWGRWPVTPAKPTYTTTCTLEGGSAFTRKKTFRVLSYQWGTGAERAFKQKPTEKEEEEPKAPPPRFQDVFVLKDADDLTATLMYAASNGQHIPKMELRTTGGSNVLLFTFTNVLVSSFRPTWSAADDKPLEEVGFAFEEMTFESK